MTPEQMRDLDERVARRATELTTPLLPWLAALVVAVGCPLLAWYVLEPGPTVVAAGMLGCAMAIAGLVHWWQSQRVARGQRGQ